jgi:hypothetical protein
MKGCERTWSWFISGLTDLPALSIVFLVFPRQQPGPAPSKCATTTDFINNLELFGHIDIITLTMNSTGFEAPFYVVFFILPLCLS